ncbi:MAG: ATPase [Bacteroidetes bacterium 4572_114]|nr:MAG: ATPase [Bacteroidetes bacterium 4572_114]
MIERTVSLQKLKAYTGKPLIKIISGMRRVGKSILLKQFRDKLFDENIPKKNILLINMESLENDFIKDYMDLYNYVKQELSLQSGKKYLLIDEVQEIEKWEKAVNSFLSDGAYDITLTGSNARMLSAELSTLLSGRYIEFPLYPFTFRDFLRIRKLNNSEEHIRDTFGHFLRYGGLPGIHTLPFSDEIIFPYLNAIYNTVLLKDVVAKNRVRDVEQLERISRFVLSNIGNITSAKKISEYLKSQRTKIAVETVQNYLFYFCQAFMLHKVNRYDLKGKKILEYSEKYYPADIGLRFGVTGYSDADISGVLETIVYLELLNRGYKVFVGQTGVQEIDFIAEKQDEKLYIQVAYLLNQESTIEREFGNLMAVKDNFPKMVLSLDEYGEKSRQGIIRKNLIKFLLEEP